MLEGFRTSIGSEKLENQRSAPLSEIPRHSQRQSAKAGCAHPTQLGTGETELQQDPPTSHTRATRPYPPRETDTGAQVWEDSPYTGRTV